MEGLMLASASMGAGGGAAGAGLIIVRVLAYFVAGALFVILVGSCWLGFVRQLRKTNPPPSYGDEVASLPSGHDQVPGGQA